jgi:hypothetical protein
MNDTQKLDMILHKLECIEKKLNIVEESCNGMDTHITFINGVYNTLKSPLDFVVKRISSIQGNNNHSITY